MIGALAVAGLAAALNSDFAADMIDRVVSTASGNAKVAETTEEINPQSGRSVALEALNAAPTKAMAV